MYTLEEEVQGLQAQISQHDQELEQLGVAFKEKNREHEAAKQNFNQLHLEIGQLADKVDPLKVSISGRSLEPALPKGYCTPSLKLTCFVCFLKIINTFLENNTYIWKMALKL